MAELHTEDKFMYHNCRDAKQASWENQLLDDYETPTPRSIVETDPLVNRITHQRGPKVSARVDLTKPLSQQIGGDHYSRQKIQPVEFIHANDLGFCEGNCIKYVCRWKYKGGIQDLEKAKHYIEMLIDMEKRDGNNG